MSKKNILVSLIVASALWAGTTAYISGNSEKYLNNYVNKSNQLHTKNGMKLSLLSFKKGFLNSKAKLSLEFIDPKIKKELEKTFKLPIVMDYEIENGPLLLKDGLALGASRIHSTLNISEFLVEKEDFKKVVKEDIVFDTTMLIDFQRYIAYEAKSNQIVVDDNHTQLTIAPIEIEGNMNAETLAGTMKMFTKSIQAQMGKKGEIKLDNVALNGEITKFFNNGFYLGNFNMGAEHVSILTPKGLQDVKNAKVNVVMEIKQNSNKMIDTLFDVKVDVGESKLPAEYNFIKTIELNYGLNGTKIEAWLAFQNSVKEVQKKQEAILEKLSLAKNREEQRKVFKELQTMQLEIQDKMALLLSDFLVKDKTTFNLKANLNGGQGNALFDIKYIGDEQLPKTLEKLKAKLQQELLNSIALNLDVKLDKSLVNQLPKELQSQLAMAMMTGMLEENNSSYDFNANYVPKTLMVNGKDKSGMLLLIEMGLKNAQ